MAGVVSPVRVGSRAARGDEFPGDPSVPAADRQRRARINSCRYADLRGHARLDGDGTLNRHRHAQANLDARRHGNSHRGAYINLRSCADRRRHTGAKPKRDPAAEGVHRNADTGP